MVPDGETTHKVMKKVILSLFEEFGPVLNSLVY